MCYPRDQNDDGFFEGLGQTKWFQHIASLLSAADHIARWVSGGRGVLVHCSDGWDRTPQVCSLAELALDSYYRSAAGFARLIEKHWISFGHRFTSRCALLSLTEEESPIFIQFLDAVYQLMSQFPSAFEFNEEALLFLSDQVYSRRFGTFLFDSAHARSGADPEGLLPSVWSAMLEPNGRAVPFFANPHYSQSSHPGILRASHRMRSLRFWRGRHLRWAIETFPGPFAPPPITPDLDATGPISDDSSGDEDDDLFIVDDTGNEDNPAEDVTTEGSSRRTVEYQKVRLKCLRARPDAGS